jgi:isohexenylglutaconyl-CoA hydratase
MAGEATIECRREDGWLTIWLDRPEARNALSERMTAELIEALGAARVDRGVRGITLRGRGGVFCAGGDLRAFRRMASGEMTEDEIAAFSAAGARLFAVLDEQPQVVVALVEGAAIAGGLGLLCAADVVVATRDARFALTETRIGLPPAQIAPYVVRRVGMTEARRIMLTGARFDGDAALRIGLANLLAEDADGLDAIEAELRSDVLRCAPGATAATKALLRELPTLAPENVPEVAGRVFARCLSGAEGQEGVAAFLERRRPAWAPDAGPRREDAG